MSKTVNTKILNRRDTSANWQSNNPILASGEIGFDTSVKKIKIGDGVKTWTQLSYLSSGVYVGTDEPSDEDVYVWIDSDGTADGVSITGAVLNNDYTLTISFSDGTSYTTGSIRGATGPGVASGGTQGQVLKKNSGTDYDVIWGNESVSDVQVNGTSIVNNGVANVPIATDSVFGVFKTGVNNGVFLSNGNLYIAKASDDQIKSSSDTYRPITPSKTHITTFYGLAKAAGDSTQSQSNNAVGTYTNQAKAAIQSMLGILTTSDVNVLIAAALAEYGDGDTDTFGDVPSGGESE